MKNLPQWLTAMCLALLLGACGSAPPLPVDRFYRIPDVIPDKPAGQKIWTGTVQVKRFMANGLYHERAILHADDDRALELKRYHYQYWVKPPALLLRDYLSDYLQAHAVAADVLPAGSAEADYRITGNILHFEEVRDKADPHVLVELELLLQDRRGELLLHKKYRYREACTSGKMSSVVTAFSQVLARIAAAWLDDVSACATCRG